MILDICGHFIYSYFIALQKSLQKNFEKLVIMAEQDLATGFDVAGKTYQADLKQIMGTLQSTDPSITDLDKIRLLLLFVQKTSKGKSLVRSAIGKK